MLSTKWEAAEGRPDSIRKGRTASGGSKPLSMGKVREENDSVHHPALEAVLEYTGASTNS